MKQTVWAQSNFKFEDLKIGMEITNASSNQISIVTNLSSNSIEVFNKADRNSFYKAGQKDADGEEQVKFRLKGFDSKNWYTLDGFNRQFTCLK